MTLYAFEKIDDAVDATKSFLWPIDRSRWLKLAVILFFLGGTGGSNPLQFGNVGGGGGGGGGPTSPPSGMPPVESVVPGGVELAIIAAIVGLIALLGVGFVLVGSVMEFVFVESLRRDAVRIRDYWRTYWRRGLRLFGFRLVVGLLTLLVVGGALVAAFAPLFLGGPELSIGLLVVALPLVVLVSIVVGLLNGFTTMFVVPVMLLEDRGLIDAWRRFWPMLTEQWKQYAAYAVMGFVLQLAAGLLAGIVTLVALLLVAIPLGLVGVVAAFVVGFSNVATGVVIAGAVLVFVLAALVISLFVTVPVQTFLRYYALFVLGATNEAFDLFSGEQANDSAVAAD